MEREREMEGGDQRRGREEEGKGEGQGEGEEGEGEGEGQGEGEGKEEREREREGGRDGGREGGREGERTIPYIMFPSAGCSPPTPPVNGSVSGFTSSRVGAQVTYHCDTDLVLVGERVATCSQSLQYLEVRMSCACVQLLFR